MMNIQPNYFVYTAKFVTTVIDLTTGVSRTASFAYKTPASQAIAEAYAPFGGVGYWDTEYNVFRIDETGEEFVYPFSYGYANPDEIMQSERAQAIRAAQSPVVTVEAIKAQPAPAPVVHTGAFAQYVEAQERAEREGRLDDFEDGVWGSDNVQGDEGVAQAAPALPSITDRLRANVRRDYDESPMRHTASYAEWHAGRTAWVQVDAHSRRKFWDVVTLIEAEQREEEARLLAEMRDEHRRWPAVKPVPVRIIDWDDAGSIQARIYVPGRADLSAVYSVTYNDAPRDAYRAAFLERLEARYQAALENPTRFFEER